MLLFISPDFSPNVLQIYGLFLERQNDFVFFYQKGTGFLPCLNVTSDNDFTSLNVVESDVAIAIPQVYILSPNFT